ncbi:hypothetical protein CspeluHIS016_0900540 [Cutaneotrichosporon spelunceum]|uniref:AMP-dependent synthetase/ligase domain-containing protein n=1 Tax=Cutaneotrichosporon spelunceum TaxID=1672016 RepID=A0AAD3TZT7_9TREE|nr:hypothetical protein CspeluHIS016_0900540 [Cutaneotrichosporon spelunceum]
MSKQYIIDPDLSKQAVPVSGSQTATTSAVFQNATWDRDILVHDPNGNLHPQTVAGIFEKACDENPNGALFRKRVRVDATPGAAPEYAQSTVDITYAEGRARRDRLGSALLALERLGCLRDPALPRDQSPQELTFRNMPRWGDRLKGGARRGWAVGIWSSNRAEWQIIDFATHAYGLIGVSLYETLGADTAEYITNHAPLSVIFASRNHIVDLLTMAPKTPALRVIVSMDPLGAAELKVFASWAEKLGLLLLDQAELEAWGAQPDIFLAPGAAADEVEIDKGRILTLCYTSGTTGQPKGVIATNVNLATASIANLYGWLKWDRKKDGEFKYLSYLPLAHMYERIMQLLVIERCGVVCFTTGDPLRLVEDAQIMKPIFMPGVPRVWNRLYSAIKLQMAAPGVKGALLRRAVAAKLANWRATGEVRSAFWDRLVFNKLRALLGGEIRYLLTGSAPLAPEVHVFLKICFACDFAQGWGMTENMATGAVGVPWDTASPGTCGPPQPMNEFKLRDIPEMNYFHTDKPNPRGELLVRGTNVFPGYIHDEVNTDKTLDSDGFMYTGDVAEIDAQGRMKIIDRVKNVVKLSQGEYVPLEKLEGVYLTNPTFLSLFVHGDSFRSSVVAVVVMDPAPASALVNKVTGQHLGPTDVAKIEEGLQDPRVKAVLLDGMGKQARKAKLNGFEFVRGVHATVKPFDPEILTPTLKLKRNAAAEYYKKEIDALYAAIEEKP